MKHLLLTIIILAVFFFLFSPVPADAQDIWKGARCGPPGTPLITTGGPTGPCNFCDAVVVTINIIKFLFQISIAIGVLMMVWGGIQMMIAGGSEEKVGKGKKTITAAFIGMVIALAAWIIVGTLLSFLADNPTFVWNQVTCRSR